MYLTLTHKDLAHALLLVSPLLGNRTIQQPILTHLLLCTEPDGLVVQAANEETRMRVRVPASVQAPGSLLVPAQTFARFIGDLPSAPVTLLSPSPADPTALQLLCQRVKAQFKRGALSIAEFPQVQALEEGEHLLTLDAELFKEIIEQIAFAAATDASRPVLQGIHLACQDGAARFAAADAFRLATRSIPIPDQSLSAELLIPASILRKLARVLPSIGAVRLGRSRDGRHLLVQTNDLECSTCLLEGVFPDLRSLLTLEAPTRVELPTRDFANAVHLMTCFARAQEHQQVRCTVEADALLLHAEAPDLGTNELRLTEGVRVSGPTLSITLNHGYLAEALAAVPTPQVALECREGRHPVTIRPVGSLDARQLIMPLTIQARPASTPAQPEASATSAAR